MAYIAPDGVIEFFADFGVDPNYENSLYFASTSAKDTYFSNMTKRATVSAQSYSRAERGYVKVQLPMSTLYNVGYMRFRNASFENKWFYAFVRSVEYVNNITTLVRFELDILTTWMGAFSLNQCFIERQHSTSDTIGSNLVEEGLDIGEYVYYNSLASGLLSGSSGYATVVLTTLNADGETYPSSYNMSEGVYAPARPLIFFSNTTAGKQELDEFFNKVNTNKNYDAVVSVYQIPAIFAVQTHSPVVCTPITKPYTSIDGYTPKNNKLFTYPYNYLEVTNMEGTLAEYKYEFFSTTSQANFEIIYNYLAPAQAVLYPKNYKGVTSNYNESIPMTSFPVGSYLNDSYKAYLAQVGSDAIAKSFDGAISGTMRGGMMGAMMGGVTGGLAGVAAGAIGGAFGGAQRSYVEEKIKPQVEKIANVMSGRNYRAGRPNQAIGKPTVNTLYANNLKDFYFNSKQITAQYAKKIDDYFTMFGYAIHEVATPNMNARPYYTYVKTVGCSIDGNVPADDASAIETIFDNGIRFWKNHANIGNYSLNNAPA